MSDQEFQSALNNFKFYLKPEMFAVIMENMEIFSDVTRKEIIEKLQEADSQVRELHEYQEKRNGILRKGMKKMDEIYTNVKIRFQAAVDKDRESESEEAEQLISNI